MTNSKKPLLSRIKSFRKWRTFVAIPLIIIGCAALVLPVIPGVLILFLGIALFNPDLAEKMKDSVSNFVKSFNFS
ncbi:MAG: hypothetical protein GY863_01360 [bacterium]|nr:hypothetical protein [bacterium]